MTRVISLFLAALAAVLSGCGPAADTVSAPGSTRVTMTDGGGYRVRFVPRPDPIPLNKHFTIEVLIDSIDGTVLSDQITLEVNADMPAHGHGMNTAPVIRRLGPGRHIADGILFHMPGQWELYCDVVRGPIRERATFSLTME